MLANLWPEAFLFGMLTGTIFACVALAWDEQRHR